MNTTVVQSAGASLPQTPEGRARREVLHRSLIRIRHSVERLHEMLRLDTRANLDAFHSVLDLKFLAQMDPDYPLMVAIAGGGNAGKSSLFNALVGREVSAVQARAGHSRRVLVAVHPNVVGRTGFIASLFAAFGAEPDPLARIEELTEPGVPKYVACASVPNTLVLLDTPDFDTGDAADYANRGVARPALEACDVLLYIFTAQTYRSLENTRFMRKALTDVGNRKVILVYRCSRELADDKVRDHAAEVIRNLYGDGGERWCLGVYRADEDDRVVRGEAFMQLRPLPGGRPVHDLLASLDRVETRAEFVRGALRDIRRIARETSRAARRERLCLEVYGDALRVATGWATTSALSRFPKQEVLRRFTDLWEASQPKPVRWLKAAGKALARPVTWVAGRISARRSDDGAPPPEEPSADEIFRKNLMEAANELHRKTQGSDLVIETTLTDPMGRRMENAVREIRGLDPRSGGTVADVEPLDENRINVRVAKPPSLQASEGAGEGAGGWSRELAAIEAEAKDTSGISPELDRPLAALVAKFRADMNWRGKVRETLTASLTIVPPLLAVSYVLATGEPVSAVGIHVHLQALFGLGDLWALVAIPAAIGLNEVDRKNLERMLAPTFREWFEERFRKVDEILGHRVTGRTGGAIRELKERTDKPLRELDEALANLPPEDAP